jgi:hypothetical protein
MRCVPSSITFFFFFSGGGTSQFDWSNTQKENKTMEAPQKKSLGPSVFFLGGAKFRTTVAAAKIK